MGLVYGFEFDSWATGYAVHNDVVLEGNSGSGWTTIPVGEYLVHPRMGAVTREQLDSSDAPVDWSAYQAYQDAGNDAFRATYSLFNLSTLEATVKTQEIQHVDILDWGIPAFDPVSKRLNATTTPMGEFLMGDFLSLGEVGTRPTDAETGTGIWGDKTGLYGLNSDVVQATFSAVDGTITAAGGDIVLGADGIVLTADGTANSDNQIKWLTSAARRAGYIVSDVGGGDPDYSYLNLEAGGTSGNHTASVNIAAKASTRAVRLTLLDNNPVGSVAFWSDTTDFAGVIINGSDTYTFGDVPASLLHLQSTAPTFRMQDTTASAKSLLLTVDANIAKFAEAGGATANQLVLDLSGGAVFIGDDANTLNTKGLTINQGAADDSILSLKSSDVAHGMTDFAETDSYAAFAKVSAAVGGLSIESYTEATNAMVLRPRGTTEDTIKTTAGIGFININPSLKSGTGLTAAGANVNLLTVQNNSTTRFILDGDGDSHQDVGTAWTNFDEHNDIALLNLASAHLTRLDDPLRESFGDWLAQERTELERLRLIAFNEDGHHFANWSRLNMLTIGAVRQLHERLERLEVANALG